MEVFGDFNDFGRNGNAVQRTGDYSHGYLCCLWNFCYTKGKFSDFFVSFNIKKSPQKSWKAFNIAHIK